MIGTPERYESRARMNWTARDLMQCDPATIGAGATIDEALGVLLERDTGEVFVTDSDRRLLGVVPEYELLKARLSGMASETGIEKVMSRSLLTVPPEQKLEDLAASFRECRNWQLAVVERGCLLGCVGRRDLLRLLTDRSVGPARPVNGGTATRTSPRLPRFLQGRSTPEAGLSTHAAAQH